MSDLKEDEKQMEAAAQEQKDILNRAEAAAYLNMAPGTLTKYAKRGVIPCRKLARRVLFSRRALELWAACELGASIRDGEKDG